MSGLSIFDHNSSPPRWEFPHPYNAAYDLIERNLVAGHGPKIAYIDDTGSYTYEEFAARVNRCASMFAGSAVAQESRVMVCMHDTIDYPTVLLGAIKAGLVPIPTNTMLRPRDYAFLLAHSNARILVATEDILPKFESAIEAGTALKQIIVAGTKRHNYPVLADLLRDGTEQFQAVATSPDAMCFWLYTSGSTGQPKAVVHLHSHIMLTAELYARSVLGLNNRDLTFSSAKLFFTYGFGASLSFPLAVGAGTVLMGERPTPEAVFKRLTELKPTVFYAVPTLYAAMLASPVLPPRSQVKLRFGVSAGEALSPDLGKRWQEHFGTEVLDGCGSTEMGHIFLSNRPGELRYGTSGKPVPGYTVKIVDDEGMPMPVGKIGDLYASGPTSGIMYWNNREATKQTFQGPWTRTGDKYFVDQDGYYVYAGRSDDMLKVNGQYVSPFEIEAALMAHPDVLEAAVVGIADRNGLIKPKAYVVLKNPATSTDGMANALKHHVKGMLAPFKYPRVVEFVAELPKTPTGKIQRFKLRPRAD